MIASTRLRFIKASTLEDLVGAISTLPFKVELKTITQEKKTWVAIFVLPEVDTLDFKNLDLTQ